MSHSDMLPGEPKLFSSPSGADEQTADLGRVLVDLSFSRADQPLSWCGAAARAAADFVGSVAARQLDTQLILASTVVILGHDQPTATPRSIAAHGTGYANEAASLRVAATAVAQVNHADDLPSRAASLPRRAWMPDTTWNDSHLRAERLALKLGDFALWCGPLTDTPETRSLIITIDAHAGAPWPEDAVLRALNILGPLLARTYHGLVGQLDTRREQIRQRLSVSQRPIVAHLAAGLTEREIAKIVCRSPHTIHDHIKSIYSALSISSRLELVDLWFARRELPPPGKRHQVHSFRAWAPTDAPTREVFPAIPTTNNLD